MVANVVVTHIDHFRPNGNNIVLSEGYNLRVYFSTTTVNKIIPINPDYNEVGKNQIVSLSSKHYHQGLGSWKIKEVSATQPSYKLDGRHGIKLDDSIINVDIVEQMMPLTIGKLTVKYLEFDCLLIIRCKNHEIYNVIGVDIEYGSCSYVGKLSQLDLTLSLEDNHLKLLRSTKV